MSIRVYQLAKELGMSSKELVIECQEAGYDVATHSSSMDQEDAEDMRRRLSSPPAEAPAVALATQPVEVVEIAPPQPTPEEQVAKARKTKVSLPTRRMKPQARGKKTREEAPEPEPQPAPPVEVVDAQAETEAVVTELPKSVDMAEIEPVDIAVSPVEGPAVVEARPKRPKVPQRKAPKLAVRPKQKAPAPEPEVRAHPQAVGIGKRQKPPKAPPSVAEKKLPGTPAAPAKPRHKRAAEAAKDTAAPAGKEATGESRAYPSQIRKGRRRGRQQEKEPTAAEATYARTRALRRNRKFGDMDGQGQLAAPAGAGFRGRAGRRGAAAQAERQGFASERPFRRSMRTTAAPVSRKPAGTTKPMKVELQEPISVRSISSALAIKASDIILHLMSSGIMATINQVL
ncbi:MAG: translation initiation factor IF-2 N-terminal domain-containing protein, partial [Phycisphaerae bacterium]|nr:translation initiation factor IF-2 N-terminal domain-containing protein [Phycisphaerae bacterium]